MKTEHCVENDEEEKKIDAILAKPVALIPSEVI
jgi:hypothetical protein